MHTRVGLPLLGRFVSSDWVEVGRFLGPNIEDLYAGQPDISALWRAAGISEVRERRMSFGAGLVMCGVSRRGPARRDASTESREQWRPRHVSSTGPRSTRCAPAAGAISITLLHPPYTAWHLSYVAFGAAAAPQVHAARLAAALGAFALAVGVSAHALDELNGRPLRTQLSRRVLIGLACASLVWARSAIGILGIVIVSPLLIPLVLAGALLVPAYNLELAGGRFHNDTWFAIAWGGFPAFTGYFVNALTVRPAGVLVAAACCLLSVAQRRLSTPARELRRETVSVDGTQVMGDGSSRSLTAEGLSSPLEGALSALWLALVLLAAGLVAVRL